MKALVLSGGTGSRLRPLTYTGAKQLIPVANVPILFHGLKAIAAAGITQVGIVVGDTRRQVIAAVGDGSGLGLRVTYIPQESPKGLAHAVLIAEDFIAGEPFLMYLGDNLLQSGVASLVTRFHIGQTNALILLAPVSDPRRFGVAELVGNRVAHLVEKPSDPRSNLALVGVYLFDQHIFPAVRRIRPSRRGELEITDAIQNLIDTDHRVESSLIEGWWKDTGTPEDVLDANRLLLENLKSKVIGLVDHSCLLRGPVVVEEGASVRGSVIHGPAILGSGSLVKDSYVGPNTSLEKNVIVRNSHIEGSVVLEGSKILNLQSPLAECLIGRMAVIGHAHDHPRACKMILGDDSRIALP